MKENYREQIDKFYRGTLNKYDVIFLGYPSERLVEIGFKKLPIIMKQSTLKKCIREARGSRSAHELGRDLIENIPGQMKRPIFAINDTERGSIALIVDSQDQKGNNLLIAVKLDVKVQFCQANEIKSIYGKEHMKEYLQNHMEKKQLIVMDKTKAETLSRFIGFQLPKTLINFDYIDSIVSKEQQVNHKNQKCIVQDLKQHGFIPTKSLLKNIQTLNQITGTENSIEDIHKMYRQRDRSRGEEKELVDDIAKELQGQELEQNFTPEL